MWRRSVPSSVRQCWLTLAPAIPAEPRRHLCLLRRSAEGPRQSSGGAPADSSSTRPASRPRRAMDLRTALVAVLVVGAVLVPAAAQNTLYPDSNCRITASAGVQINVTCTCRQTLRQTTDSPPITHLTIIGCRAEDQTDQPEQQLSLMPVTRTAAAGFDFVLPVVHSLNVSLSRLRLDPVRGRNGANILPLRSLHIEHTELTTGLPDGALQGLQRLERVSLRGVTGYSAVRSSLADLPRLRELSITESEFQFINTGAVARTPRLRRIQLSRNVFSFINADAISVENDNDDDIGGIGSACDGAGSGEGEDDDSFLEFSNVTVNTMNTNAVRVGSVRRLLAAGNSIGAMYAGALNVSLFAPSDCRPLAHFTENSVTDMRADALALESGAAQPALLELGGNVLLRSALSPVELRLSGEFERRPLPALPPDQFDCSCCECPSTRRLIELVRQSRVSRIDMDVFVTDLALARCANDPTKAFLNFASECAPDAGLRARVAALVPDVPLPPAPSAAGDRRPCGATLLALPLLLAAACRR